MNREENCVNNIDLTVADLIMQEQPPCCRVAFCIKILSELPGQMRDIGKFKKDTGFVEGNGDTETAINFLKAVKQLADNKKNTSGSFQA